MGELSRISWTHHTFNGWWGCHKVSRACKGCYAEAFAKRTGHDVWGANAPRRFFADKHFNEPLRWQRKAMALGVVHRVFCGSMSDIAELHINPDINAELDRVRRRIFLELVPATPNLVWMFTTKRADRILEVVPQDWLKPGGWPPNVWWIVTIEEPGELWRARHLLEVPAPVRGVSVEPLVSGLSLEPWLHTPRDWARREYVARTNAGTMPPGMVDDHVYDALAAEFIARRGTAVERALDWVILGGESGQGRTSAALHPMWARVLRDETKDAGRRFHFKQYGTWAPGLDDSRFTHGGEETWARAHRFMYQDGQGGYAWVCDSDGLWSNHTGEHRGPMGEQPVLFHLAEDEHALPILDGETWQEVPDVVAA